MNNETQRPRPPTSVAPPTVVLRFALPLVMLTSVASGAVYTGQLSSAAYWSTYPTGTREEHIVTLDLTGVTPTVSLEANGPNSAHAVVAGSIGPGVISLSVSGTGSLDLAYTFEGSVAVYGRGQAHFTAYANETFVLDGEGISGATRADVAISYYMPWTSQTTSAGSTEAATRMGFSLGGLNIISPLPLLPTTGSNPTSQQSSFGTEVNTLPAGRIVTYEFNVPVGTPFELLQSFELTGGIGEGLPGGTAEFSANAAVYWHGISQVTVEGLPVSGYTLRNSEGIDFTGSFAPVPEPDHYAAFAGTALVAFGLWRRTQNKHSRPKLIRQANLVAHQNHPNSLMHET